MVEPSKEIFPESGLVEPTVDLSESRHARPPGTGLNTTKRGHTEDNPRAFTHPAAHPAAPCQNGRCLPALRSGRVCNGRSPPPPSRAWRPRAPDEGRCRADPHCTHDGHRRHCRNDHRYFHAVHQPPAPLRRRQPRITRRTPVLSNTALSRYASRTRHRHGADDPTINHDDTANRRHDGSHQQHRHRHRRRPSTADSARRRR